MRVAEAVNPPPAVVVAASAMAEPSRSAIDADHDRRENASPEPLAPLAVVLEDDAREQLVRQANELSAHLRSEAEHVDRREAQLHARLAELEQQLRSATLFDLEHRVDLERRGEELDTRERELCVRAAGIQAAERFVDAARLDIDRRLEKLQIAERSMAEREHALQERERMLSEAHQQLDEHGRRVTARLVAQRDELDRHAAMIKEKLARGLATLERRRTAVDGHKSTAELRIYERGSSGDRNERSA